MTRSLAKPQPRLRFDTEFRPGAPLALGPHRALGEGTVPLGLAGSLGGHRFVWTPGDRVPAAFEDGWHTPAVPVVGANVIVDVLLVERHIPGFSPIDRRRLSCTAARAATIGLPAGLDACLAALGAPIRKDPIGSDLMLDFAVGTKNPRGARAGPCLEPAEHPEKFAQVMRYCEQDVACLEWLDDALPELPPAEFEAWMAHLAINARGVFVDEPLARGLHRIGEQNKVRAEAEFMRETGGINPRSPKKVLALFQGLLPEGTETPPGMAKEHRPIWDSLFHSDPPEPETRGARLLSVRDQALNNPGDRAMKFLEQAGPDGRCRDLFRFNATHTRRWASGSGSEHSESGAQAQNLPRPSIPDESIPVVRAIARQPDASIEDIEFVTPQVREALASTLRAVLIPAPGRVYGDLDFSKIEPITLAWLVGAVRRLQWIRSGGPLYEMAVAGFFGAPPEEIKGQRRQVGKILELLAAYAGEGRRLHAELTKAGIRVTENDAHKLIANWRRENPEFVTFWHESVTAFAATTATGKDTAFAGGRVRFERDGDRLCCVLPSGGVVSYWHPSAERGFDGTWRIAHRVFKGGQWWPSRLHAGTLAENITSSLARDVLAHALIQAEQAGLQVVLHAHDQIVVEGAPEDLERLRTAMETLPEWASELQLTTSGGIADCFTK